MRVRPYRSDDLPQVVTLWQACGLTRPWNDPATDIAFCVQSPQAGLLIANDEGGQVIGTAMVGHDGHRGWVYYVAVHPTQQGTGLGAALMAQAEAWLKARGVPKLQLMVRESNAQARGFYEKLGYRTEPVITLSKWLRKPAVEPDGH
jgi:ribosomal protein S18 acetylase RimI-like enzyme